MPGSIEDVKKVIDFAQDIPVYIIGNGSNLLVNDDGIKGIVLKISNCLNEIEVDGIFIDCYGEARAEVCREQKIDVMIDDDPYNYKMISSNKCKCLLFDDRERFNLRDDYVTNWLEVEDYIEELPKWEEE